MVALLSFFAELLFLQTSQEGFVVEQCGKGQPLCLSVPLSVFLFVVLLKEETFSKPDGKHWLPLILL